MNKTNNYCLCNCGGIAKPGRKYIIGHNRRNVVLSEDHKEKIRKSTAGRTAWNKDKVGVMPEPWNKGKKGLQVGWAKGLTKEINKSLKSISDKMKGKNNPMSGKTGEKHHLYNKHHSKKTKTIQSKSAIGKHDGEKNGMFNKPCPKGAGHGKGGIRKDIGIYVRSTWEANFARILNLLKIFWLFEFKRFELVREDKTILTYCPDFYAYGIYWEVKGYMSPKAIETIKLFREQYPEQGLGVIDYKEYQKLEKEYKDLISNWED